MGTSFFIACFFGAAAPCIFGAEAEDALHLAGSFADGAVACEFTTAAVGEDTLSLFALATAVRVVFFGCAFAAAAAGEDVLSCFAFTAEVRGVQWLVTNCTP